MARSGVGLCLSGGGYRAALFHLGALRRLHELGILRQVDTISSVSGGSIIAALIADKVAAAKLEHIEFHDWDASIARPFRKFVDKDLRTKLVLKHALWNWVAPGPRARELADEYQQRLTGLMLSELPAHPEFVFCATDMIFAVNWEFSRARMGDYQAGYIEGAEELGGFPVARAVAASACFPPIFGPIPVGLPASAFDGGSYEGEDKDKLRKKLSLTDGGVYDNLGLEPVRKSHAVIISSDGGAPFEFKIDKVPLRKILRYSGIGFKQVSALRLQDLHALINQDYETYRAYDSHAAADKRGPNPCPAPAAPGDCYMATRRKVDKPYGGYWNLADKGDTRATHAGWRSYPEDIIENLIANIRTDLDRFTPMEISVLENHGYAVADNVAQKYLGGLITTPAEFAVPNPDAIDAAVVRKALEHSGNRLRFWRRWLV